MADGSGLRRAAAPAAAPREGGEGEAGGAAGAANCGSKDGKEKKKTPSWAALGNKGPNMVSRYCSQADGERRRARAACGGRWRMGGMVSPPPPPHPTPPRFE